MKKINIDPVKLLPILGGILTVTSMIVSNKIDSNNRNSMKKEIKEEIMRDLADNK